MSGASQREWVFDGTRGEFWAFAFGTLLFLLFLIRDVVQFAHGQAPHVRPVLSDWIALVAFAVCVLAWWDLNKLFRVAFGIMAIESCLRILIAYGKVSQKYAFSLLLPVSIFGSCVFVVAAATYLSKRLRHQVVQERV